MATKQVVRAGKGRDDQYSRLLADIVGDISEARRAAARSVNAVMTATYWLIGRRIVELEQGGSARAAYGEAVLQRLSDDLTARFGRGFSSDNLELMRSFYVAYPERQISETVSRKSGSRRSRSLTAGASASAVMQRFQLSWSHYGLLVRTRSDEARTFYEAEALRGGWTVRQLSRQIDSQFYERTMLSRDKRNVLTKGRRLSAGDRGSPEEQIKDPFVLEFLDLKDEYSESNVEEALITHLETFLLELGGDFAFIGRQRRLRVGDAWYRVDLLLFHRRLRCLVVVDLKLGKFTHSDAGQMHLYLNYAREHWTMPGENPPVGIILCAQKDAAVAHYALGNLPNKVVAAEYRTALPNEKALAAELRRTQRALEAGSRPRVRGSGHQAAHRTVHPKNRRLRVIPGAVSPPSRSKRQGRFSRPPRLGH